MSNEVEKASVFGGAVDVTDMASLAKRAQQSASNSPRGGAPDGSQYLNFSGKRGIYNIGERAINSDELFLVNVTAFEDGWVCWKAGKPAAIRMANIYNGTPVTPPADGELGPFPGDADGWFQAKSATLKSLFNDEQGYFRVNSVSAVDAMAKLVGAFADRAEEGLPYWPVVELHAEEFTAQSYKNFKPKFNIVGWLDKDQLAALADGADIEDLLDAEDEVPEVEPPVQEKPAGRTRRPRA